MNLSSDFSLFSHKKGVKLLKISLEKGLFSNLRPTMEYPFFMEVPVPGSWPKANYVKIVYLFNAKKCQA